MKVFIFTFIIGLITQSVFPEEVRLLDLDPPEAQQAIEKQDQSLHYAPKIESSVPAVRFLGNEPHNVLEDIYLARQYHGQDGLGGYLYGYNVPDIAKTEKKKAGGDLRGAYNYIAGNGQEIKVEYWDDGTGFHQVDNVPKNLPEDLPDVKAEKERFLARWHEEAERNMHPIQSPYNSEGQYASGPLSPQAQLQQKQLLAAQQQNVYQGGQYQQPNPYGQTVGQYQKTGGSAISNYQPTGNQYQSGGQYQQSGLPNPYLQGSASNQYQQTAGSPTSQVNGYQQSGQGQVGVQGGQNQQPNLLLQSSATADQNKLKPPVSSQSSGFQAVGAQQGFNQQPNPYVQASASSNQNQQSSLTPSHGTGAGFQAQYQQSGQNSNPYLPGSQQYSGSVNLQSSGSYASGSPAQSHNQPNPYVHASTSDENPTSLSGSANGQNQIDYTGQYSENRNIYSHQSGQHQKSNEVDDGSYDGRYDEEDTTGPPKGFFYSFEYPVGIIVSKEGGVAKREGSVQDVYNENKEKFQAQLQAGQSNGGSQNGYLYVKN